MSVSRWIRSQHGGVMFLSERRGRRARCAFVYGMASGERDSRAVENRKKRDGVDPLLGAGFPLALWSWW